MIHMGLLCLHKSATVHRYVVGHLPRKILKEIVTHLYYTLLSYGRWYACVSASVCVRPRAIKNYSCEIKSE